MGAIELQVRSRTRGGVTVLDVHGDVDGLTTARLRRRVMTEVERSEPDVVVDLTDVGFVDAQGLGVLVAAHDRARERAGSFVLVSPSGPVRRALDLTGVDRIMQVERSVEDALTAMPHSPVRSE